MASSTAQPAAAPATDTTTIAPITAQRKATAPPSSGAGGTGSGSGAAATMVGRGGASSTSGACGGATGDAERPERSELLTSLNGGGDTEGPRGSVGALGARKAGDRTRRAPAGGAERKPTSVSVPPPATLVEVGPGGLTLMCVGVEVDVGVAVGSGVRVTVVVAVGADVSVATTVGVEVGVPVAAAVAVAAGAPICTSWHGALILSSPLGLTWRSSAHISYAPASV